MIDDLIPPIATPLAYLFLAFVTIVFIGEMIGEVVVVLVEVAATRLWRQIKRFKRALT